jgi:hypothetical protein
LFDIFSPQIKFNLFIGSYHFVKLAFRLNIYKNHCFIKRAFHQHMYRMSQMSRKGFRSFEKYESKFGCFSGNRQ